jgi:hypothetical protein
MPISSQRLRAIFLFASETTLKVVEGAITLICEPAFNFLGITAFIIKNLLVKSVALEQSLPYYNRKKLQKGLK